MNAGLVAHLTDALGRVKVPVGVTPQLPDEVLSVAAVHALPVLLGVPRPALLAVPLVLDLHVTAELLQCLGLPRAAAGHPVHGRDVGLQTEDGCAGVLRVRLSL